MIFYLNWHRNQQGSKSKATYLLNKKSTFYFNLCQFLCQLRYKFIQYLILRLQSMVQWARVVQNMLALIGSEIALCKSAIQYIKPALFNFNLTGLYLAPFAIDRAFSYFPIVQLSFFCILLQYQGSTTSPCIIYCKYGSLTNRLCLN